MLGTEVGLGEGRGNEEAGPQVLVDEGVEDGARLRKGTGGACADDRPGDWMDLWVAASWLGGSGRGDPDEDLVERRRCDGINLLEIRVGLIW